MRKIIVCKVVMLEKMVNMRRKNFLKNVHLHTYPGLLPDKKRTMDERLKFEF